MLATVHDVVKQAFDFIIVGEFEISYWLVRKLILVSNRWWSRLFKRVDLPISLKSMISRLQD